MKRSDELFNLIHQMNPAEKRYFKRFSSIHSDKKENISIRIFDSVDRSTEPDNEKWQMDFKDEKVKGHLHVSRNYLLKNVLKSLRNFHSSYCIEASLKELLAEIEILSQKKLYQHAARLSFKVLREAEKLELFLPWAEALNWAQRIRIYSPQVDIPSAPLGTTMRIAQAYAIEVEMEWINNQWIAGIIPEVQTVSISPQMLESFRTLRAMNAIIQAFTLIYNRQYEQALDSFAEGFKIFQENTFLIEEKPTRYFINIQAYVHVLTDLQRFKKALQTIEDSYTLFKSLNSERIQLLTQDFQIGYFTSKIKILNLSYSFKEAEETLTALELFLQQEQLNLYDSLELAFQKAVFLSNLSKYAEAKNIMQNILNMSSEFLSLEMRVSATLFNLMLSFALKKSDLETLKVRVFNIKRWMGQKDMLNDRLSAIIEVLVQKASNLEVEIRYLLRQVPELPGIIFSEWVEKHIPITSKTENE